MAYNVTLLCFFRAGRNVDILCHNRHGQWTWQRIFNNTKYQWEKKVGKLKKTKKVAQQVWKSHCDNHPNDSMKMSWIRTSVEMVWTKLVEHFILSPRPDGNPSIQSSQCSSWKCLKVRSIFFHIYYVFLWEGILEF